MDIAQLFEGLLPDEIEAHIAAKREARDARIDAIGRAVSGKRKEAVDHRKECGIEAEWDLAEDAYAGVDDANRQTERWLKPASPSGAVTRPVAGSPERSSVFLNITRPYTDAAAARLSDILQPSDDRNWVADPTPIPELLKALQDHRPVPGAETQGPLPAPPEDENAPPQAAPPGMPAQGPRPMTVADAAQELMNRAQDAAKAAEKRIDDWLVECQYRGEIRDLIMYWAKYGTGVLKGPVPRKQRSKVVRKNKETGETALVIEETIVPGSKAVHPRNAYPDPACGNNIHNGSFFLELDELTGRKLRELKGLPGYLSDRIDKVLEQGPERKFETDGTKRYDQMQQSCALFKVWYFYGELDEEDFAATQIASDDVKALCECVFGGEGTGKTVPAIVTLVNDEPIRVSLNPLESNAFPYDMVAWQERDGGPWGYGVPMQINTPQRMVNAATRNMMDNAGLAGGPILVVDQTMLEPVDGNWTLRPRMILRTLEGAMGRDVRTGIMSINIPMMQAEMQAIINFGLKMAEDVTGLPMLLQGQLGKAPDTVGGMQMLMNSASSFTRRLARSYDDNITEPHIRRYYEWLLIYGPEEREKGDLQINARASSALIERDAQAQTISALLQLSVNPVFGLSPARCMEEFLKAQKFDAQRFKLTPEEKQQASQQQPAPPPQIAVAQIREQGAMQRAQLEAQVDMARVKSDTDRDVEYQQALRDQAQVNAEAKNRELEMKWQIAQLEYATKHNMQLNDVKKELAIASAKMNLTRELAAEEAPARRLPTPPVEPPGRAQPGMSFTQ